MLNLPQGNWCSIGCCSSCRLQWRSCFISFNMDTELDTLIKGKGRGVASSAFIIIKEEHLLW